MLGVEDIKESILSMWLLGLMESDMYVTYIESSDKGKPGYFLLTFLISREGREYKFEFRTNVDRSKNRLSEGDLDLLGLLDLDVKDVFNSKCRFKNSNGYGVTAVPYSIKNPDELRSWVREVLEEDGLFETSKSSRHGMLWIDIYTYDIRRRVY